MQIFKYQVTEGDSLNLGKFLRQQGLSKQAIAKAKHEGGMILVNHHRRFTTYRLQVGDTVYFLPGREKENHWLKPSFAPIEIVLETANYLVVNKPAGILSIPSRYEDGDSVVNRLLGYFERTHQAAKPHIVTRLDRDTSGLVLVGKNAIAHAQFSRYHKDLFIKKYHALVHGEFPAGASGLIDQPIAKISTGVKRHVDPQGKRALTEYQVLAANSLASLVELRLLTGRTHQIRVHLAYLGHPLYGDALYGANDAFPRQALHCFYLAFPDPFTGKDQTIKIPDPPDMQALQTQLL